MRGSVRLRERRAENSLQSHRKEISTPSRSTEIRQRRCGPFRASKGTEISTWSKRAEISSHREDSPSGRFPLGPEKGGAWLPPPYPALLGQPPQTPLSGTTFMARLVAALTLGSPASGIRVPIPDPPRACARDGREAGAAAPPPPALDSAPGNPEGKGREGGRTVIRDVSPGDTLQPGGSAPLLPLRFSGALIGEGAAGRTRGRGGARRGWRLRPSGRKVGRRQAEGAPAGPGLRGAGALAHLLVPRPGPGVGGCCLARTRLGAGLGVLGAGSAAPGERSLHPTGAAAVSAPRLCSGSRAGQAARARAGGGVRGGVGAGPAWARPGAWGPGLAPPQSDAPRAPHVALRPLGGGTHRRPPGRTLPH